MNGSPKIPRNIFPERANHWTSRSIFAGRKTSEWDTPSFARLGAFPRRLRFFRKIIHPSNQSIGVLIRKSADDSETDCKPGKSNSIYIWRSVTGRGGIEPVIGNLYSVIST